MFRSCKLITSMVVVMLVLLAVTSAFADGYIVVPNRGDSKIHVYDSSGNLVTNSIYAYAPLGVGLDPVTNDIYYCDSSLKSIYRARYNGNGVWGSSNQYVSSLTTVTNSYPAFMAFNSADNTLYMVDALNNLLTASMQRTDYTSSGVVTATLIKNLGSTPKQLAFDPDGNLWVSMNKSGLYRLDSAGNVVQTISGNVAAMTFGPDYNGDGRRDIYATMWRGNYADALGIFDYVTGVQYAGPVPLEGMYNGNIMSFGPDWDSNGIGDLYIANSVGKTSIYNGSWDGSTVSLLAIGTLASGINGSSISVATTAGQLPSSEPVPEPGALMALGTGLLGLAGLVIRKR